MSLFALWLSKALWGWEGLALVCGITLGIGLLAAGIVHFSSRGAGPRR